MPQYTSIYHTPENRYFIYYREKEGDTWLPYLQSTWQHGYNQDGTVPDKQLSFSYRSVACEVLALLRGESYSVTYATNFPKSEENNAHEQE